MTVSCFYRRFNPWFSQFALVVSILLTAVISFASEPPALDSHCTHTLALEDTPDKMKKLWEHWESIPAQITDLLFNGRNVARGLPEGARRLSTGEVERKTFRHYTKSKSLEQIRREKSLKAGATPYVASPFVYTDIKGIFLTDLAVPASRIGLDETFTSWIDVQVDKNIPVIFLEKGIYVVPGVGDPPAWMKTTYQSKVLTPSEARSVYPWTLFNWETTNLPVMVTNIHVGAKE